MIIFKECLGISEVTLGENAYEQPAVGELIGVWIDDVFIIAHPVDFDLCSWVFLDIQKELDGYCICVSGSGFF